MQKIKLWLNQLKQNFLKEQSKPWGKNRYIRVIFFFLCTFIPLIIIDQVSKAIIYDHRQDSVPGETQSNGGFIAGRSQFHTSTTFLDAIGHNLPIAASLAIDYILVIVISVMIALSTRRSISLSLSVVFTGILGNTIDASHFSGVRNVMFIPYNDNGTFNFADLFIVVGAILTLLAIGGDFYQEYTKNKASKEKAASQETDSKDDLIN